MASRTPNASFWMEVYRPTRREATDVIQRASGDRTATPMSARRASMRHMAQAAATVATAPTATRSRPRTARSVTASVSRCSRPRSSPAFSSFQSPYCCPARRRMAPRRRRRFTMMSRHLALAKRTELRMLRAHMPTFTHSSLDRRGRRRGPWPQAASSSAPLSAGRAASAAASTSEVAVADRTRSKRTREQSSRIFPKGTGAPASPGATSSTGRVRTARATRALCSRT